MAVTVADIKTLNTNTGAGMLDCKKALVECNGDVAAAEKLLREKGLAAMAKRQDRATAEGRIYMRQEGNKIAVVEVTCETDFVANNADFVAVGEKLLDLTLSKELKEITEEHKALVNEIAIKFRENMSVSKVELYEIPSTGTGAFYIHGDKKTGAVVIIDGSNDDAVKTFAYDCCLHIAAFTPAYTTKAEVPQSYIDEQKEIFEAQMAADPKMEGKPQKVKDGILQGKINKNLAEICFEDQMFVKDDKKTVAAKLAETGKAAGASLKFATAKLYLLGK